ncbi:hypothetical protein [Paenibacillus hamazuiensis]|uniref:hypothetical protein n=1 Tax=Paenibacillus hamazuiensis TaxID=2936508 RepID=UPI00200BFF4A|nr:hypothetical protein [Paenibacillus hamazuiensis]
MMVISDWYNNKNHPKKVMTYSKLHAEEVAVIKPMQDAQEALKELEYTHIDFGRIGEYSSIHGLIGLDMLIPGKFIIDLSNLQLNSTNKSKP